MTRRSPSKFNAPFLKRVLLREGIDGEPTQYPYSVPFIKLRTLDLSFSTPVTLIVGENGTGKSTLLEAIAAGCGFNLSGGSADHRFGNKRTSPLVSCLRFSWLPKITRGFFMRAESFFNLASYIDEIAREHLDAYRYYGEKSLHSRSHGEAFLALFQNRFDADSIYILDEPEAALSPSRQMIFLRILKTLESQNCQIILTTHSPMLMAYPNAEIFNIGSDGKIQKVTFRETSHYLLMREFIKNPESFIAETLRD